jgi:hypothetical protein
MSCCRPRPRSSTRSPPDRTFRSRHLPLIGGVNVFGYLQGVLGLGEASRLVISALDAVGISLVPIEGSICPNARHEHSFAALPPPAAAFPIDILCSNPSGLDALVSEMGREFFAARYSIAYWWWEVDGPLPFEWRGNLDLRQEMWAASRYIAACLGAQLRERPRRRGPHRLSGPLRRTRR